MLDKELELTLNLALQDANRDGYQYFTVEHLILALLDNPTAAEIIRACISEDESLRVQLKKFIRKNIPLLPPGEFIKPTLGVQRVLRNAVKRAVERNAMRHLTTESEEEIQQRANREEILLDGGADGADVLISVFEEIASRGVMLLQKAGVTEEKVYSYFQEDHFIEERGVRAISTGLGGASVEGASTVEPVREAPPRMARHEASTELGRYTINLNAKAKAGLVEPVIGRDDEILQVIQVLSRRRKNNPLLVGDPGVGKTAIAEGLAQLIIERKVPRHLLHNTIYSLDVGALLAGTKMRGEFEERMTKILDELAQNPHAILFIDEIHTIIGAGAASGGSLDISNLIKPMLASGELKCIGATTYEEYRTIFEKEKALARRFQKIDVSETSVEQTIQILQGVRRRFEKHHTVQYLDDALTAAVELSKRYMMDRFLPDKAIDIIDEAGALHAMLPEPKRSQPIDADEIASVIAKIVKVPVKTLSRSDKLMLASLEDDLKAVIFGQDQAISALVSAIKLARSGLRAENKPVGSFLLAGPTGVGKTEVTKQLSDITGMKLLRFDMSEYAEKHTVARLIGAPPGYVGYEKGGLLTDQVNQYPYSVVLLDEIEKAHPDIYNLLLQVMDNGFLTDSLGRHVDFRHAILIMTTNVGAGVESRRAVGFTAERDTQKEKMAAIGEVFTPEFRNRLDAIIQFKPLSKEVVQMVVDKQIKLLQEQLAKQNVVLEVDETARIWFAENGYDPAMGARPMERLIQDNLKKPLADELLFGRLSKGGKVKISVKGDQLELSM
ncbi:MAG: AAA family ATPase [Gammaproteobacteria bacterium]|nr:AAA family ATPase [Gammaproteobacteria bacterium]